LSVNYFLGRESQERRKERREEGGEERG